MLCVSYELQRNCCNVLSFSFGGGEGFNNNFLLKGFVEIGMQSVSGFIAMSASIAHVCGTVNWDKVDHRFTLTFIASLRSAVLYIGGA